MRRPPPLAGQLLLGSRRDAEVLVSATDGGSDSGSDHDGMLIAGLIMQLLLYTKRKTSMGQAVDREFSSHRARPSFKCLYMSRGNAELGKLTER